MKTDAELIQETREKLGIPRWKLASLADVHELTIFNLEHNRVKTTKETLIKVLTALIVELKRRRRAINV